MKKELRQQVFNKYNGKCAYTGKSLESDWQVDHITSKIKHEYDTYFNSNSVEEIKDKLKKVNNIDNLFPALRIVNHYKRGHDLEGFRKYMINFHLRLSKLPKKTLIPKTEKRKDYMYKVANAFGITIDIPFDGKFYFETITK